MGKTSSTSDVLKNILKDVSNVQNIIDDTRRLEKSCTVLDFDDVQEVEKIIEATKTVVDNLKAEATKIYDYFHSNYKTWNCRLEDSADAQVNNNNECDIIQNDEENSCHVENVNEIDQNKITDSDKETSKESKSSNVVEDSDKSNCANKNSEGSEENTVSEPKMFLKCVDINKLINPDILPHLTSPKPLRTNSCDDAVLIISDSEEERGQVQHKNIKKNKVSNVSKRKGSRHVFKGKAKSDSNSGSDVLSVSKRSNLRRRTTAQKKYKEISDSMSSSSSDEDSDGNLGQRGKKTDKKPTKNTNNVVDVNTLKDKKLFYKAYVPLPRVPCEKLKQSYYDQKEIDDVDRLTNLKRLKKRNRKGSSDSSSNDSDKPQNKSKRKRKLSKESSISEMEVSNEGEEVTKLLDLETAKDVIAVSSNENDKSVETEDVLNNILNRLTEDSEKEDKSHDEEEKSHEEEEKSPDDKEKESDPKEDKDESKKKKNANEAEDKIDTDDLSNTSKKEEKEKDANLSDKNSDEHKSEDSGDEASKKKKSNSKWTKDKLLTDKLSDTDTEDEFEKFKKLNEKAKSDAKASPAKDDILQPIIKIKRIKKKTKKVFSSDSDSDRKKDSSEDESDEKKSSSSSSEEEEKEKKEKKTRRRIKRVNDSSDEDGVKSTRRTIRKVIAHTSLSESTKKAEKDEQERKQRILERQKKYNQMFDCDKPADATLEKVVLDFNEETKEELLSVDKDLVKVLKPHQGKGIQFMWDACFESMERAKTTNGSGCILAHCMGLGKTLQVIALSHTLLNNKNTQVSKVLVVCPLSTVLNWTAEYKKWLENIEGDEIELFELVSCKQSHREFLVEDWHKKGGVLIIGYDMFRNLTNPKNKRLKKKARDIFHKGLVNPGPDLVVCDEGHLLKNEKSNLSIAMNRIQTARRIVLTGTPMQNNMKEYYCMVQFVKPNLLGTYKEYLNRFVNPITNGQYTDSTPHDINIMRKRSHVLHKLLDGVVQRKDYSVLTPFLPPKYEYVLFLTLTETQIELYRYYKENFAQRPVDKQKSAFLFNDFQVFQRICTHPRVLLMKSISDKNKYTSDEEESEESEGSLKDFIDDDESEAKSTSSGSSDSDNEGSIKSKSAKKSGPRLTRTSAAASGIDIDQVIAENKESNESNEWWRQFCNDDDLENIKLSSKLYLLFQILQECELMGDKVLVFSQSLYSLDIIEYFLAKIDDATQQGDHSGVCGFSGSWSLGLDYFRLDGSSSCDNRAAWCKRFNSLENPRARLFLISTRAGGLGINLVGANRVVIFDVSWNPSHDTQSIYRIYRFGQTKPCYIYRFVIWGTIEMKIYERQVTKQAISKRVIDEQQIDRHYNQNDLQELYNFDPTPTEKIIPLVPKDVLLAEFLQKEKDRIYKYHEHQSLLENKEDEELNEAERKAAWEEFESEKTRVNTANTMGWIKDLPLASVNMALLNIIQKDNPDWTKEQVIRLVPMIVQQLRQQVDAGQMMLFERIAGEVRQIQAKYQDQLRMQQQQQQLRALEHFRNQMYLQRGLGFPNNPNEIVELND